MSVFYKILSVALLVSVPVLADAASPLDVNAQ